MKKALQRCLPFIFCVYTVFSFAQGEIIHYYPDGTQQTTGAPKAQYSFDKKNTGDDFKYNNGSSNENTGSTRKLTPQEQQEADKRNKEIEAEEEKKREEERKRIDAINAREEADAKNRVLTSDEVAMKQAVDNEDFVTFFGIFNNPDTKYNKTALGGGVDGIAAYLYNRITVLSETQPSYLLFIYRMYVENKMGYYLPPFYNTIYNTTTDYYYSLNSLDLCVVKSCIVLGKYDEAIDRLRQNPFYGKKFYFQKSNANYDAAKKFYTFTNCLAGHCFEQLHQPDSAKYYLKMGEGFDKEWKTLSDFGIEVQNQH